MFRRALTPRAEDVMRAGESACFKDTLYESNTPHGMRVMHDCSCTYQRVPPLLAPLRLTSQSDSQDTPNEHATRQPDPWWDPIRREDQRGRPLPDDIAGREHRVGVGIIIAFHCASG